MGADMETEENGTLQEAKEALHKCLMFPRTKHEQKTLRGDDEVEEMKKEIGDSKL